MLLRPMCRNGSFDNGLLSQYFFSGLLAFISVIYTWWVIPPFPCPFNTIAFGYSTARWFATSACTAIAKALSFSGTPSSFIQHVKELSLILNLFFHFRTHLHPVLGHSVKPSDWKRLREEIINFFIIFIYFNMGPGIVFGVYSLYM